MQLTTGVDRGWGLRGFLVALALLLGPGCAGKTRTVGSGTGGSDGTAGVDCPESSLRPSCDPLAALVRGKCTIDLCHGPNMPSAGLDLMSACPERRVVNIPAVHDVTPFDAGASAMCPPGAKLIDTTNPTASWMLIMLHDEQGSCGHGRNVGFPLSNDDAACLEEWFLALANGG